LKRTPLKRTEFKRKTTPSPKQYRPKPKPKAIKAYWTLVASLGCIVTRRTEGVTIHHVHGGSMRGILERGRGMKQDWFVLPLHAELHTAGATGIDTGFGVDAWEKMYGTQWNYLMEVMRRTGVDPFEMSGLPWPEGVDRPI